MYSPLTRFAFVVALAAAAVGCNQQAAAPTAAAPAAPAPVAAAAAPDAAVLASVKALRTNNVAGLLENALPAGEVAKMKADWVKEINKDPVSEEDRRKFAEQMSKLTAPGAEDKLFAELEPQLKQFEQQSAQQMPMMIAMGQGFIQSAIQQSKDLNDQQKQQTTALIDATAKWAQTAKFTDAALAKQAIGVICKTARDLNLKTVDEARALSYDQAMQKAGIVLGGLKQVFALYGLSMDKALDSVKVETVSANGDAAKVKVTYTAFDQPFTTESDLVKLDGKWYSKQAIAQWAKAQEKEQEMAKVAAPASEPAAAK
ncbi:MAG TPA: hypothetical protein VFE67_10255 [Rudaea sp.]|nr:hypothetical protein [Rudaea sp.]